MSRLTYCTRVGWIQVNCGLLNCYSVSFQTVIESSEAIPNQSLKIVNGIHTQIKRTQSKSVLIKCRLKLTPAQEVVPVQVLLLCKHSHHNESVQVYAFTEHPEIIAAQHVHVEKVQHFTANLQRENKSQNRDICNLFFLFSDAT